MTGSPCYGCDRRAVGCRSLCDPWKAWEAIHQSELEAIRKGKPNIELVRYNEDLSKKIMRKVRRKRRGK